MLRQHECLVPRHHASGYSNDGFVSLRAQDMCDLDDLCQSRFLPLGVHGLLVSWVLMNGSGFMPWKRSLPSFFFFFVGRSFLQSTGVFGAGVLIGRLQSTNTLGANYFHWVLFSVVRRKPSNEFYEVSPLFLLLFETMVCCVKTVVLLLCNVVSRPNSNFLQGVATFWSLHIWGGFCSPAVRRLQESI